MNKIRVLIVLILIAALGAGGLVLLTAKAGVEKGVLSGRVEALLTEWGSAPAPLGGRALTILLYDSSTPDILAITKPLTGWAKQKEKVTSFLHVTEGTEKEEPVFVTKMKEKADVAVMIFDGTAHKGRDIAVSELRESLTLANEAQMEVNIIAHRNTVVVVVEALAAGDVEAAKVVAVGMEQREFKALQAREFPGKTMPVKAREWVSMSIVASIPPSIPIEYFRKGEEETLFYGEIAFSFMDLTAFRGADNHYQPAAMADLSRAIGLLLAPRVSMGTVMRDASIAYGKTHGRGPKDTYSPGGRYEKDVDAFRQSSLSFLNQGDGLVEEDQQDPAKRMSAMKETKMGSPFSIAGPKGWREDGPRFKDGAGAAGYSAWMTSFKKIKGGAGSADGTMDLKYNSTFSIGGKTLDSLKDLLAAYDCRMGYKVETCGEYQSEMSLPLGKGYLYRIRWKSDTDSPDSEIIFRMYYDIPAAPGSHILTLFTKKKHIDVLMPEFDRTIRSYRLK